MGRAALLESWAFPTIPKVWTSPKVESASSAREGGCAECSAMYVFGTRVHWRNVWTSPNVESASSVREGPSAKSSAIPWNMCFVAAAFSRARKRKPFALNMASALKRITVLDKEAFPCKQCLMRDDGPAFWDLFYLQRELLTDKPLRFCKQVHTHASESALTDSSTRPPADANVQEKHRYCTTIAVIAYLLVVLQTCRLEACEQKIRGWLCHMCQRVCNGINVASKICGDVELSSSGLVGGFSSFVQRQQHAFVEALKNAWDRLYSANVLTGSLDADVHSFQDIVLLFAYWDRTRKKAKQRPLRGRTAQCRDGFAKALFGFLATALEWYLRWVYIPQHDVDQAPPPLRGRKNTKVSCGLGRSWARLHDRVAAQSGSSVLSDSNTECGIGLFGVVGQFKTLGLGFRRAAANVSGRRAICLQRGYRGQGMGAHRGSP